MRIFGFFSYRYIFGANFGKISQSQTFRDEIMAIYVGFSFYRYICNDLNFLRDSERRAVRLSFLSRRHALSHRLGSEYIWQRLQQTCFIPATIRWLDEWMLVREALKHRPFNPDSPD